MNLRFRPTVNALEERYTPDTGVPVAPDGGPVVPVQTTPATPPTTPPSTIPGGPTDPHDTP